MRGILLHVLLVLTCVLTLFWTWRIPGAVSHPRYNQHPVLMVVGFIGFMCEAILVWRMAPDTWDHNKKKRVHLLFQTCAFVCMLVGLFQIFTFHRNHQIPDLYSAHAVVGMTTSTFFTLQYGTGLYYFWAQMPSNSQRKDFMPFHRYLGLAMVSLVMVTIALGCLDRQRIDWGAQSAPTDFRTPTNTYANVVTLLSVLGTLSVSWVVMGRFFRIEPLQQEQCEREHLLDL